MSNVYERWEAREPLARVAFFGSRGPEEVPVYEFTWTGGCLSLAVDRHNGVLTRVLVPSSHLIYLIDRTPRTARGMPPTVRAFFDNGQALDLSLGLVEKVPSINNAIACFAYETAGRVRVLISLDGVQEMVPLNQEQDDLITMSMHDSCEIWPEFGHKR